MLNTRQQEILERLKDQPFFKTHELETALKLTRARINQLIVPLIKRGFVKREGRARATVYSLTGKKSREAVISENWQLKRRVMELEKSLDDRKVIERAKEILIAQFDILPTEAYRKLQEQSMEKGRSIREMAERILAAYEF